LIGCVDVQVMTRLFKLLATKDRMQMLLGSGLCRVDSLKIFYFFCLTMVWRKDGFDNYILQTLLP